jgi:hypothetical protein
MSYCIRNSELCFADSAKSMNDNSTMMAVTTEFLVYFRKFLLSCHKVVDFRNIRQTKGDRKVLALSPWSGKYLPSSWLYIYSL